MCKTVLRTMNQESGEDHEKGEKSFCCCPADWPVDLLFIVDDRFSIDFSGQAEILPQPAAVSVLA